MGRPVVVCDSREQRPYQFPDGRVFVVRRALPAGDYSIEGMERELAVERKELGDLVNTITGRDNRERWKRELEKLRTYRLARVVVEACVHDVLAARYRSPALPSSVLSAVLAVEVDYGIPVVWAGDRASAERYVEALLLRAARVHGPAHQEVPDVR
jgi:DNA excision repair protein ERCC-4